MSDLGIFETKEAGDRGAGQIDVEYADGVTSKGEGEGELHCDGGFANTSFSRENLVRDIELVGWGQKWSWGHLPGRCV